jgi:hypothetical protein
MSNGYRQVDLSLMETKWQNGTSLYAKGRYNGTNGPRAEKDQPCAKNETKFGRILINARERQRARVGKQSNVQLQKCPTNMVTESIITDVRAFEGESLQQPSFYANVLYLLGKAS